MATIKQVAERAGVSTATVSKYLNGIQLKERNENAVKSAIEELDYKVNSFARSLRSHKSMTIGVLIPELSNLFATQIISEIENSIMHLGYSTIVCDYKGDCKLEKEKLSFLIDKIVDALVIMPFGITKEDVADIDIPVVFIDRKVISQNANNIYIDNQAAIIEVCEYLIENGHSNIGILCGTQSVFTARERLNGYKTALKMHCIDINDDFIKIGKYDVGTGYTMTKEIIGSGVTALIATNYELTMGAVIALNEANIIIPDELSFVGFDAKEFALALKPKLSMVIQPIEEMGRKAAQILTKRLTGDMYEVQNVRFGARFLKKDSVKNITE